MLAALGQDLRYALRQLRKSPGFTAVSVLTLALGIGVNTAMFSVVEGVILAPLRFFEPNRLVMIWENNPRFPRVFDSYPNFQDWQQSTNSFKQMAAFRSQEVDITSPGAPSHLKAAQISSGFFAILGVRPALGREFTPREDLQGGALSCVISNRLWKERFGGEPDSIGKIITLNGLNYSIVGVAPSEFRLNEEASVFTPLGQLDPLIRSNRATHDGIFAIARLKSGVSIAKSQAEMTTIQNHLDHRYPVDNQDLGILVEPLKQAIIGDVSGTLNLLFGAVGFVLLITCANIANLFVARSAARGREFAIRSALGADRPRLIRQLLTESVLLSLVGACFGGLIAFLLIRVVLASMPDALPRSENVGVNASVLLYTLIVSLAVGILSGLAPALKSWTAHLQSSLKEAGRGSTMAHRRTQSSFIVVQVASTLMLLVGAGLLLRTVLHLWKVNPGFDTRNVIALKVGVSPSLTKTPMSTRIAYQQLIERIRQIPGVEAADFTTAVPLSGKGGYLPFWLDSKKPDSLQGAPRMGLFLTGPDYLRAMGMQLVQGRYLNRQDTTQSQCVAVIDSNFARRFFPDGKSIGHTITAGFAAFGPCIIVGVVNHVKYADLSDAGQANQYQAYYSLAQDPDQWVALNYPDASVMVRSPLEFQTLIPAIRKVVYQAGNEQPVYNVQTMKQIVSGSMSQQRFPTILLGSFAALALLLASVGIYGTISYSVTQRVQEIGIRMALGADKGMVLRLFIVDQMRLVLGGIAVGAAGALILTKALSSMSHLLFGVQSGDPLTFVASSITLIIVSALASYLPAIRAARVDPIVALRYE